MLIALIVKQMDMRFAAPEKVILVEGEQNEVLFMIIEGSCGVKVGNYNTTLTRSEYFGEISLLFNTRCTGKVTSQKYCTFACLH